uniref:Lipocalin/cytosolic fatty-acid binding domain-containing protein n=1 Tax=Ornithorhynchus anatinus TaxID=9258 RepID=F6SX48_ORNAN
MKVLLLSIGLALVCAIQAVADVSDKPISFEKLAGPWHTILLATNDKEMIKEDEKMKLLFKTVTPQNTKELIITMLKKENHECTEYNLVIKQTEEPNKFQDCKCLNDNEKDIIIFVDSDYLNYFLVVFQNYNEELDREDTVVQCLSRTFDLTTEAEEKFNKVLKDYNISEENVINLNNEKDKGNY